MSCSDEKLYRAEQEMEFVAAAFVEELDFS